MRKRLILLAAAATLLVGQPAPARARDCEDICGELAAEHCVDIDSTKCGFYIAGCLAGCSTGKLIGLFKKKKKK